MSRDLGLDAGGEVKKESYSDAWRKNDTKALFVLSETFVGFCC